MDIDRQIALIEDRLDIEDFKDSDKLAEFIDRFTNLWDVNNSSQNAAADVSGDLQPVAGLWNFHRRHDGHAGPEAMTFTPFPIGSGPASHTKY